MLISAVALVLNIALPGLAIAAAPASRRAVGQAASPGAATSPNDGLAISALTCGVASWLLVSGVLERTVGVTRSSSWTATAVVSSISVAVLARRGPRMRLGAARRDLAWLAAAAGIGLLVWAPIGQLALRTRWGLITSTPWYYWNLAQQIETAHHLPATSIEWGARVPFLSDYQLFSTATATLLAQAPGIGPPQAVMVLTVVLVGVGSAALPRALGCSSIGSLVAVPIAVGTGLSLLRLGSYRPEPFGIGLGLLVIACLVHWLRQASPAALAAVALGSGALWKVHGIAFTTTGVLCVAAVVAYAPHRTTWAEYARRAGTAVGSVVAVLAIVQVCLATGTSAALAGGLADRGGRADLTWQFVRAIKGLPLTEPPTSWSIALDAVGAAYRGGADGLWLPISAVAALVALVVLGARRGRVEDQASQAMFFVVGLIGVLLIGTLFAYGWDGYVPRRTGAQRILLEATILVGPALACGVDLLRRFRAVSAVVLAAALAVGLWATASIVPALAVQRPTRSDVDLVRSVGIRAHDVVLANVYGEGFVAKETGAVSLLDGRAPYTFPEILRRSLMLMRQGQAFFEQPLTHLSFLARHDVRYVLVSRRGTSSLGTSNVFATPVDVDAIRGSDVFTQVGHNDDLTVFRVDQHEIRRSNLR